MSQAGHVFCCHRSDHGTLVACIYNRRRRYGLGIIQADAEIVIAKTLDLN